MKKALVFVCLITVGLRCEMTSKFVLFPEYKEALDSVTKHAVTYMNGGAGSGKSTFIKYIRKIVPNTLVLAPTGIAALNVQGRTIHSFFKYPPSFLTEDDIVRPKSDVCQFLRTTDLIIIDEISMVSSNVMDAIDESLQMAMNNRLAFGGIPILIVGDLFQLSPIVGNNISKLYYELYDSEYFFDSNVIKNLVEKNDFKMITLKRIMRQNDDTFINVLNAIRKDEMSADAIDVINEHCKYQHTVPDEYVQITPYNDLSDATNNRKLNEIDSESKVYYGTVTGKFNQKNFPVDQTLKLKVGAQIMIRKNLSREIANGTIGKILELHDDHILVHVYTLNKTIKVERVTWDEFGLMKDRNGKYKNESVGSYTQFPVRLAWSMTIHNAQGTTIQNLYIDLGRGAFATGMLYVALSRATSLEYLVLSKPLDYEDVLVDHRVVDFYNKFGQ